MVGNMYRQFKNTVEEFNMLSDGCAVVAAVSGGADSVALLCLLREYMGDTNRLLVVHVEHGIRGEDSKGDARFVEKLCEKMMISCHIHHIQIPLEVEKTGETIEEAARRCRYEILKKEAEDFSHQLKHEGMVKIAVAHHMSDQAETVLMNLVRGSHLKGLTGMQPVNGDIIRPLLYCRREDIEAYLKEKDIDWCIDYTNDDTDYTRNLIRHEILPLLEKINSRALEHISESADELRKIECYFAEKTNGLAQKYVDELDDSDIEKNKLSISDELIDELQDISAELIDRVIYKVITTVAGRAKDITGAHVESVRELFYKQVGRSVDLPYQLIAKRDYGRVVVSKKIKDESVVPINSQTSYEMTIIDAADITEIEKKEYTKYFDYDIIGSAVIRKPMDGDYLTIDDKGHRKLLHKYLKDEKISQDDRKNIDVLADGNHILWVVGYRISEAYKVTASTKRILRIRRI